MDANGFDSQNHCGINSGDRGIREFDKDTAKTPVK